MFRPKGMTITLANETINFEKDIDYIKYAF